MTDQPKQTSDSQPQPAEATPPQSPDSGAMDGQSINSGAVRAAEAGELTLRDGLFWLLWQTTDRSMIELTKDEKVLEFVGKTEVGIEKLIASHLRAELEGLRKKLADSTLYADGGIRRYDDYGVPMLRVDETLAALDEVISKYGSEGAGQ